MKKVWYTISKGWLDFCIWCLFKRIKAKVKLSEWKESVK